MTPFRHFSDSPKFTHRLRQGGLYVAVAALLATHTACSNSGSSGDWEAVTEYEVTKGVKTTLEEVEPDKFEVVDEQVVEGKDASSVVVKRLTGQVDTLSLSQAQTLVTNSDTTTHSRSSSHYHGHSLGRILWWSSMGYMMGRNFNSTSPAGIYRNGSSYAGVTDQLRSTARTRTEMRPIRGRSGFFSRSGRSGFGS
ncbi:hypothetical protein [Haliscomenobacter sp.]|uniref:hypothetical protein n=1 Tax=Haliscomenobacter sp. TaxID=2717303 RepID=UPI003364EC57